MDIKRRERNVIIKALRAGVVPRLGLQHLRVGRAEEIKAIIHDLDQIQEGEATIRFVVGAYGSGKTFLLNLSRLIAHKKRLVVMSADLAPNRRLHGAAGQARSLYAELARNASTHTSPNGGAMAAIVERFANKAVQKAKADNIPPHDVMRARIAHLEELKGGYDFVTVITRYQQGFEEDNDELKNAALRWLRAEYTTKMEARKDLGVRTIIDDASVYDHLKLMALFVRAAGYKGLLVSLDEMVTLYKLAHAQARKANYEQLLRILNDVLQGNSEHIGFLLGGTPEFISDERRGLYGYEPLRMRLAKNVFANNGLIDASGPVIRLANLSQEDMYVLLRKIRQIVQGEEPTLPDKALRAFMAHCSKRIGNAYFQTPRNSVKAFVDLLAVLEQNPKADWKKLLGAVNIAPDTGDDMSDLSDDESKKDDDLASFKL